MIDDDTRKFKTITRCKPRDREWETYNALRLASSYAPAEDIRASIEQLLRDMEARRYAA